MINYYVIQVNTGWFEVRRNYSNIQNNSYYGLSDYEVIDAFEDESDALSFVSWLEGKDGDLMGFYP